MSHFFFCSRVNGRFVTTAVITGMLFVSGAWSAAAQETASALPASIERFVDSKTTVVGWLDLSKIELDELAAFRRRLLGDNMSAVTEEAKAIREALVQLGVTRVYWVDDLSGLTSGPRAWIIPAAAEKIAAVAVIANAVAARDNATAIVDGSVVLAGDAAAVAKLQSAGDGSPTPELLAALKGVRDPHGLIVITPVAAMIPFVGILPKLAEGDSDRALSAAELLVKLKSITVAGELPPANATLRLTLKSADAVTELTELVNAWTTERLGEDAVSLQLKSDGDSALLKVTSVEQAISVIGSVQRLTTGQSRPATMNSLKQFGLAMHNFHDVYGHFPPQSLVDKDGRRLLSWRVLILPYLDAYPLYQEFRLDEPWDSEHNRRLIQKMPDAFRSPSSAGQETDAGMTRFVAPLTANSIFGHPGPGVTFKQITDGTSNTILLVEAAADRAVIWTKPDDLTIDPQNPLSSIIGENEDGFAALFCDGSARVLPNDFAVEMLQAILSMNGGEIVDWNK